jgi:hypothetical protein
MPVTVETGTGLPDAEAYGSVAEMRAYCEGWGYQLTDAQTDQVLEQRLRRAAAAIDTAFGRYKGRRLVAAQALEFPREGCTDWGGIPATGVPARVKRASFELAFKALTQDLQADLARGGKVVSQSVGPISTTYAADAPAGKLFALGRGLLEQYLLGEVLPDMVGPAWEEPSTGPHFGLELHDDARVLNLPVGGE